MPGTGSRFSSVADQYNPVRSMATIDASIVIIAMPAIFRGIHLNPLGPGNISYLLWMIMGYLLVQSVLVVTLGRLGDMFGRVRIYNLGLASTLPRTLTSGLRAQGVPASVAGHVAHLPPVSTLFSALLGYNPMRNLLGPSGVLARLPARNVAVCLVAAPARRHLRAQDRSRRDTAAAASFTFASASGPPCSTACVTQWPRWSSSSPRATACSARVTADTWVRTSMQ
jgi:MFS family permease